MSQDRTLQESQYRLSVSFIGFYESYLSAYRHRTILAYRSDSSRNLRHFVEQELFPDGDLLDFSNSHF